MPQPIIAGIAALIVIAGACTTPRGQTPSPSSPATEPGTALRLAPMDSATIERLCAKPDSVRAGKAECVLKDQGRPLRELQRTSPPPPPR